MKYRRILIIIACIVLGSHGEYLCNELDKYHYGLGSTGMVLISLLFLLFLRILFIEWRLNKNEDEIHY